MMLQISDLSFSYLPGHPILEHFSLAAAAGERVCVKGVSGKGKTTLLRLIAGLEQPSAGVITLPAGCKTTMVFQNDRLLPWLTAKGNVALCADEAEAARWLSAFGLRENMNDYPAALSGGMCRRVALARAVAASPDLLLLDEAFKGIDPARKEEIMALLKERFCEKLILFTSHDDAEIAAFATRGVEL
jgi:ABC-type nitrate/sulfonate/bicarbonate transport system ATPase subunit